MDHAGQRGAARIDLNTSVDDIATWALYESAGFTNRARSPGATDALLRARSLVLRR
jgi:hypothetical protein